MGDQHKGAASLDLKAEKLVRRAAPRLLLVGGTFLVGIVTATGWRRVYWLSVQPDGVDIVMRADFVMGLLGAAFFLGGVLFGVLLSRHASPK